MYNLINEKGPMPITLEKLYSQQLSGKIALA
jgi:hypothetical protein